MNISEFARIAGVSKAAVSRYFNDGYLSETKREQIRIAVEKTGYAPSLSAQSIRKRVTKLIGVILPKLSSDSCARITEGISSILSDQGYELLLVNTANDHHKEIKYLDLFRQNRVDGVILLASVFTPLHKTVLKKMRIPVVIAGQEYQGFNCVCHDDFGAANALTNLLLDRGVKHPAFIGVDEQDRAVGYERKRGFLQALESRQVSISKEYMKQADFSAEAGYEAARRLFKNQNDPDGIFCATDTIASGVMRYCLEKNIRVPGEVRLAAVGNSKVSQILSLTTSKLHYRAAGAEAANMLLSAIYRPNTVTKVMRLGYEIIERDSTK